MKAEDSLPVLPFPRPKPKPQLTQTDPDGLAQAVAALRVALEAEPRRLPSAAPKPPETPEGPDGPTESVSPVGAPHWRAGWRADWRAGWRAGPGLPTRPERPERPERGDVAAGAGTLPKGRDPQARRITAVHFPRLSIERWLRWMDRQGTPPPDDLPVALAIEGPHGPIVHATNRAADMAGIHQGARVVDMRALCPELQVEYADIAGDKIALERLMLWARRWCPWTTLDGAAGLVMDTTGSDHLWGGEAEMLREIETGFSTLGLSCDLAIAPTHGAAWALSRFGNVREVCTPETLAGRVAPLSVRALRLTADTALLLNRLGLKTIGDLADVPRTALARRFARAPLAQNPLMRLDQLTGQLAEPVNAPDDPPRFAVQAKLAEPVQDPTEHLPDLARELCAGLTAAGFGARRITLTIYRTDGETAHVSAATARASRDPAHLLRLFDGKLDRLDPGFGFDLITLGASVAEDMTQVQTRLDGGADDGAELAKLTDRLTARFGAKSVKAPALHDSHMPERREHWLPAMGLSAVPPTPLPLHRPLRLLDPPEEVRVVYSVPEGPPAQFIWRRIPHKVVRFAGPERIAPEWWADRPGTRLRDYYRIEDQHGRRFWLYREGVLGDGRGGAPRWCLHGIFA